jgi:arylsulfatase A-like enzyme
MTMDMFPTFLELAGTENTAELHGDGISLVGHLLGSEQLPERTLFWKMGDEWAVRQGKWKLCRPENGDIELFDLVADVGESKNLADQNPEVVDKLKREYEVWLKDVTKGR